MVVVNLVSCIILKHTSSFYSKKHLSTIKTRLSEEIFVDGRKLKRCGPPWRRISPFTTQKPFTTGRNMLVIDSTCIKIHYSGITLDHGKVIVFRDIDRLFVHPCGLLYSSGRILGYDCFTWSFCILIIKESGSHYISSNQCHNKTVCLYVNKQCRSFSTLSFITISPYLITLIGSAWLLSNWSYVRIEPDVWDKKSLLMQSINLYNIHVNQRKTPVMVIYRSVIPVLKSLRLMVTMDGSLYSK